MKFAYAAAVAALLFTMPADAKPIAGSNWELITQTEGGRIMSCTASKIYNNGEVRVVIGSQGSIVLIFKDMDLIRKLTSENMWRPGMHYNAVLFPGNAGRIVGEAEQIWKYSLLMRVAYTNLPAIRGQNAITLALNGLVTQSFNVSGIGKGIDAILSCAKSAGLIAK